MFVLRADNMKISSDKLKLAPGYFAVYLVRCELWELGAIKIGRFIVPQLEWYVAIYGLLNNDPEILAVQLALINGRYLCGTNFVALPVHEINKNLKCQNKPSTESGQHLVPSEWDSPY